MSMRNSFLVFFFSFVSLSCSSDSSAEDDFIGTVVDKKFSIRSSELITYFLGDLGENGTAYITVQAKNFSVSTISQGNYVYEPKDNFVGEDYVEVVSSVSYRDTNGNDVSRNTKTRISIDVTN